MLVWHNIKECGLDLFSFFPNNIFMELRLQVYKHVYPSSDSDHRLDGGGAALRFTLAIYGYDRLVLGNISLIV